MDDRELDRLFGKESESDKEAPEKDGKAPAVRHDKKRPGGQRNKVSAEKKTEKNTEKNKKKKTVKTTEKKESEDKETDKRSKEENKIDSAPVSEEDTKKKEAEASGERTGKDDGKSSKAPSGDASGKPSEDLPEEDSKGDREEDPGKPSEDGSEDESGDKKEDPGKSSEGDTEEGSGEDGDEEDAGDEERASGKDEHASAKPAEKKAVRRQRARPEPVPDGMDTFRNLRDMIPLSGKSLLAIGLAIAVVIMVVLIMFLPAFRVRNTSVEGNVVLTDQEILKAVGLEYDAHLMSGVSGNIFDILRLDYGKTEQRIKKENPYVEDIRITIKLPSTVDIKVKERSKVCYIRTPDGYAALDKDGIVLELSSFDSRRTVRPVICGLNVKYAELGKPVKIENMNDYKKSIIVLGAILAADNASVGGDYSMFENTSEVRILPSGYIFLTIYSPSGNLMQIKLNGTDSIGDNMAWLLYAFNANAFDKVTVDGALDMTGDEYIFDEYD